MAELTPSAEPIPTPDAAVYQVRQTLAAVTDLSADDPKVDRAARDAVAELWDSPVRTFVPMLAARAARDRLNPPTDRVPIPRPDANAVVDSDDGDSDTLHLDPRDNLTPD